MAFSPGHKFGQLIGEVLEMAIEPILSEFAKNNGLYLDKKGPRPARDGQKVCWTDLNGNKHDLDFVLERGGSPDKFGVPVAFIEAAWRRYTKHSRNKAQEIQGAILPLFQTHEHCHPFTGAVLAGVFTEGALKQLKSLGFTVAYFPYETVIAAFARVRIDASFDETTADAEFKDKFLRWDALVPSEQAKVSRELVRLNADEINTFVEGLRSSVLRTIKAVRIFTLHGKAVEWANVHDAISFIQAYNEQSGALPIVRYEVEIIYLNGDKIWGAFAAKDAAIEFLNSAYSTVATDKSS
jgi:hypothetical protein